MQNNTTPSPPSDAAGAKDLSRHLRMTAPSPWVARFAPLVAPVGTVLDLAAGGGRHGRHFLARGCRAVFVDRDVAALADLADNADALVIEADLEDGADPFAAGGPLADLAVEAAVVTNYLHRPLFDGLIGALKPGGVLIYETFARGNEAYARPRNPDHLLRSGELLNVAAGRMQVVAYEHGRVETADIPGVKQRLCAVKDLASSVRDDGEPPAHDVLP